MKSFTIAVAEDRLRNFKGTEIPSASRTAVVDCGDPDCGHAHLVGLDEAGKPLFEIVVNEEMMFLAFEIINGWKNK